jgi:hypothetical protein
VFSKKTVIFKKFYISLIITGLAFYCAAQNTIQGLVIDAESNTPLPGCNVFIANTTKGTSTDVDGTFRITGLQPIPYDLVISFIGYKTQAISVVAGEPLRYKIMLSPITRQLNEVIIRSKKVSRLKRGTWLRTFRENFIGRSDNANDCKLENPDILSLDKEGNVLTATSDTSLVLRNNGLGYRIKIMLEMYKLNTVVGSIHYEGHMVYELITPRSRHQKVVWARNRLKAYYGSQMHFIRSLYNHTANKEGFFFTLPSTAKTDSLMRPRSMLFNNRRIKIASIVDYSKIIDSTATKRSLRFSGPLEISYINEGESVIFQRTMKIRVRKAIQVSYIKLFAPAEILPDGRTQPVNASQVGGYWSWELMSESLPLDYDPAADQEIVKSKK